MSHTTLCQFCQENGTQVPAVRAMPQSDDQGKTVTWYACCDDHAADWWSAADWDGRHLEFPLPVEDHIKVEYDTRYTGGDYSGVGEMVYIPVSLIAECGKHTSMDDAVDLAFRKQTHIDSMHIIHYTTDERYTKEGHLILAQPILAKPLAA